MYVMHDYDNALRLVLDRGVSKGNKRTGVRTLALCGVQCRYSLREGFFPFLTRRKINPRSVWAELVWFLSGSTNVRDLQALGSHVWDPWEDEEFEQKNGYVRGALGPVYGHQLRHFGGDYHGGTGGLSGFDQLSHVIELLQTDPTNRRILFSLWNPNDVARSKLPPCHLLYQVFVDDLGHLTGMMTQRSCDLPVGVPFNVAFYAALTCMLARLANLAAVEFVHSMIDCHVYENQISAVEEYLSTPLIDSPSLDLSNAPFDLFSYRPEHFLLTGLQQGPKLTIPVAV